MVGVQRVADTRLPTRHGEFRMIVYAGHAGREQIALTVGAIDGGQPVLVRLHSECLTGDVFGSARCDCGEQLEDSLWYLQQQGRGLLLYLRQEGRGIGLTNKIRAYALQDRGYDTVEANLALGLPEDARDYRDAAAMLRDLGLKRVRLLTNNLTKVVGLRGFGLEITERIPIEVEPNGHNERYLKTKAEKLNHVFEKL